MNSENDNKFLGSFRYKTEDKMVVISFQMAQKFHIGIKTRS